MIDNNILIIYKKCYIKDNMLLNLIKLEKIKFNKLLLKPVKIKTKAKKIGLIYYMFIHLLINY